MSLRQRRGVWRTLCASAAALSLSAFSATAETARGLPASALALPLPASDLSKRLADETAPPTNQSESKHPGNLGDVGRSLVLPGWGALHQGHRNVGLAFLAVEAGLWTTVAVASGQGSMRAHSSVETAQLYAGIDLDAHDDHFKKLVNNYQSSDEY